MSRKLIDDLDKILIESQKLYNEYKLKPKSINRDIINIINSKNMKCTNDENKIEHIGKTKYLKDLWRKSIISRYFYNNLYKSLVYRENNLLNSVIELRL